MYYVGKFNRDIVCASTSSGVVQRLLNQHAKNHEGYLEVISVPNYYVIPARIYGSSIVNTVVVCEFELDTLYPNPIVFDVYDNSFSPTILKQLNSNKFYSVIHI